MRHSSHRSGCATDRGGVQDTTQVDLVFRLGRVRAEVHGFDTEGRAKLRKQRSPGPLCERNMPPQMRDIPVPRGQVVGNGGPTRIRSQRKLLIRENYYGRILKPNHNRVSCFPKFEPITRLTFLSQVFVYYTGILSLGKKERMSKLKLRDSNL